MEEEKKEEVVVTEAPAEETPAEVPSQEIDYKALADAEKARADAAEALIIKNKSMAKREEKKNDDETTPLTEEKVAEIVAKALAQSKETDDSPEAKAYAEAQAKVKELQTKNGEIARALKAKEGVSKDSATTHRDGEKGTDPKLPENSPLKAFKHEGNGIYSLKLASGKTMFKNVNAGPGQPKSWIA